MSAGELDPDAPTPLKNILRGTQFRLIGIVGRGYGVNGLYGSTLPPFTTDYQPSITMGLPPVNGCPAPLGPGPTVEEIAQVPYYTDQGSYNNDVNNIWRGIWNPKGSGPILRPTAASSFVQELEHYLGGGISWQAIVSTQNCSVSPLPVTFQRVQHSAKDNIYTNGGGAIDDGIPVYDMCSNLIADQVFAPHPSATSYQLFGGSAPATQLRQSFETTIFGFDLSTMGTYNIWTGTSVDGSGTNQSLGSGWNNCAAVNPGTSDTDAVWGAFGGLAGDATATDGSWIAANTLGNASNNSGYLYAISEVLTMPFDPPPPIDPNTIPLVNPRVGVCRPWCVINLPGGIGGNVVQPQPIQLSTKMRNVKRLHAPRGWRRVTLEQYKNIKAGKATFLGGCYRKKK